VSPKVVGWAVFKTLVYTTGFTYACWIIFWRCMYYSKYLDYAGSHDLALVCEITAGITWAIWTFSVGCIIVEGMKEVQRGREHGSEHHED
jgi:hypothetical protein